MNAHALELKRMDLLKTGKTCMDASGYPHNFKPVAQLTVVMAWQTPNAPDFGSAKKQRCSPATVCAVIFMGFLAVVAVLGTYYACELLVQRVENMQQLRYSRPQASISDVWKYANPR